LNRLAENTVHISALNEKIKKTLPDSI
jgi:hypothetical protein